jgi:hypothetical protein
MANLDLVNNDKNLIDSNLVSFANKLISEARQAGKDLKIFEGYRSNERQDYLFKVKKTTTLKGGQSKHNAKPSKAITILEYINNKPTWGNFPQTEQFKKIVNNLLMDYGNIEWGGNWTKPLVYQFEIMTKVMPKDIIPAPVPTKIINVNPMPTPTITPKPVLIPASVKMEVDNSSLIIGVILLAGFLYFKK